MTARCFICKRTRNCDCKEPQTCHFTALCLWTMLTRALIGRDAFSLVHHGPIHTTAAGFTD